MGSGRQERDRDRRQVAARLARGGGRAPGRDHRRRQGLRLPCPAERLFQIRTNHAQGPSPPLADRFVGLAPWAGPFFIYGAVAACIWQPAVFISSSACSPVSGLTAAQRLTSTRT